MERLSIFDIYKIGIGPSSSHTLGPWNASLQFVKSLREHPVDKIQVHLFGSLSKTGKGHATDIALQLGLQGFLPEVIDTSIIPEQIQRIQREKCIYLKDQAVPFDPKEDIIYHGHADPAHPNTLLFIAYRKGEIEQKTVYYSLGGGFIQKAGEGLLETQTIELPFPIDTGSELLSYTEKENCTIPDIVHQNELCFRPSEGIDTGIELIFNTMLDCVYRGCHTGGILPGGLNVKRRAKQMSERLLGDAIYNDPQSWIKAIRRLPREFNVVNSWVSCFALAVNEENAALGRVVTSPTNGAAGVIPAVLLYYHCFCEEMQLEDIRNFFYTSGEIGCLFKKGATISAAVGGCQAEIGVSSAMAAGGLTQLLGGSPEHVLMAAEIAMEHHLGLTCDPIGGLVQIPCIERNAMGAMKAITASTIALSSNPKDAIVKFDVCVKAMWDTAQEMNGKYKGTSEGGLAFNLPVIIPEC